MKIRVIIVTLLFATTIIDGLRVSTPRDTSGNSSGKPSKGNTMKSAISAILNYIGTHQDAANSMEDAIGKSTEKNDNQLNDIMESVTNDPGKLITQSVMKELVKDHSAIAEKAGTRSIRVQSEQGFNGFSNYQPSGWRITETVGDKADNPSSGTDEKVPVYTYPKGVGPVLINSCTDSDYSKESPCYASKQPGKGKVNCPNLMDAAAYIGVGFDGRGFYKIESRRASLVQRACANMATYMGHDVPDTMNVFGIYETTAETKSFQSANEYMRYIREKAGLSSQDNLFRSEASQYSKSGGSSGNLGALGTIAGAYLGGPAGAAVLSNIFGAVGSSTYAGSGKGSGNSNSNVEATSKSEYRQTDESSTKKTAFNHFFAMMYINVIYYEISLDDLKPQDINLAALKDYMSLPASFYSVGADVKYQNFLMRWGTHFIRSAKFGGQLKITKTAKSNKMQSIDEFASIAETEFQSMFSSLQSKHSQQSSSYGFLGFGRKSSSSFQKSEAMSESNSASTLKQEKDLSQSFSQSEFTNTIVEAQGGTPLIAEALVDFYTPAFRGLYRDWIVSIKDYIKPFEFQLRSIDQLFNMNMDDLFPSGDLNFGCMGSAGTQVNILTDPMSKQRYYLDVRTSFETNETTVTQKKVYCKYDNLEDFKADLERRRISLEKAVAVYITEGPFPTSTYALDAGQPGCEEVTLAELKIFSKSAQPMPFSELKKAPFLISFDLPQDIPNLLPMQAKYIMMYRADRWFAAEPTNQLFHLYDSCELAEGLTGNKICFFGIIFTYEEASGFFHIQSEDFQASKQRLPVLPNWLSGSIVARASALHSAGDKTDGSLANRAAVPCNVKWLNSHRLDPNKEVNCIHFTAASEGDLFVIFSSIPRDRTTWYYLQISNEYVAYYHAMLLKQRDLQKGMGILGDKNLYQSFFVCAIQTNGTVMMQYGKADADSEVGTVYSSYAFLPDSQYSRLSFYAFGAGSHAVSLMDIRLTRKMPKVECLNTNYVQKNGHCVFDCHSECIQCNRAHDDTACLQCANLRVESEMFSASDGKKVIQCVTICPAGYQLSETAKQLCVKCPVGTFKEKPGSQKCVPCYHGTFSSSIGSFKCTECAPGSFCNQNGSSQCQKCPLGTSSKTNGSTVCNQCAPGTFATTGQSDCSPCPLGQFTNMTGQAKCLPCSAGFFAANPGQSTCAACPVGTSSTAGSMSCANNCDRGEFSPINGIPCRKCAPGTYAESAGSTSCSACPSGSYQPSEGQTSCIATPAGSYAVGPGASIYSLCPAGSASALPHQTSPSACIPCAAGSFSDISGSSTCSPCPAGNYTEKTMSSFCKQCPSGSWSKESAAGCILCQVDSYSHPGSTSCTPCPDEKCSKVGSASCTTCPTELIQLIGCVAHYYRHVYTQEYSMHCDHRIDGNTRQSDTDCAIYWDKLSTKTILPAHIGEIHIYENNNYYDSSVISNFTPTYNVTFEGVPCTLNQVNVTSAVKIFKCDAVGQHLKMDMISFPPFCVLQVFGNYVSASVWKHFERTMARTCLKREFINEFDSEDGTINSCGTSCIQRPRCQGFRFLTANRKCQLFEFDKCSHDANMPGCTKKEAIWIRNQQGLPRGHLCGNGYRDGRYGSSFYKVISLTGDESERNWTQAKLACDSEPGGLTKLSDINDRQEAAVFVWIQYPIFVGGYNLNKGDWRWTSCDSPILPELWMPGQPTNNDTNCCTVMRENDSVTAAVSDISNTPKHPIYSALCECVNPFAE